MKTKQKKLTEYISDEISFLDNETATISIVEQNDPNCHTAIIGFRNEVVLFQESVEMGPEGLEVKITRIELTEKEMDYLKKLTINHKPT